MRARQSYSMQTFAQQVSEQREDATFTAENPDPFGTYRTLVVDSRTSEWLEPILEALIVDARIEGYETVEGGLHVTFARGAKSESRIPFPIVAVERTLTGDGHTDDTEAVNRVLGGDPTTEDNSEEEAEAAKAARHDELSGYKVAELREWFNYPEDDKTPKKTIVREIIEAEFG